jgi:hypothetical protein
MLASPASLTQLLLCRCCFLFLLPLRIFLFSSIVCRMLKFTKIFKYTPQRFREYYRSILRANCKYWCLIFLHHWFSLYGSVAYIRNMVTLATIQSIFCIIHIFKGNLFMQRDIDKKRTDKRRTGEGGPQSIL